MRDFFERQDTARRLSLRLAVVLAVSVAGTVLATAFVLAVLATVLPLLQVVATTRFAVDLNYWRNVFVDRLCVAIILTGVTVIGLAIYRTVQALESGGTELARKMGGTRILALGQNPQYQQLMDIVEELCIVTGTPAPKVFVLENEAAINAFAAGVDPKDTVVGVTQGALEHLNRAQLQGILAHEFSHIVNRDVRINSQTLGVLQGIEVVTSAANYLLRMGVASGFNGSMLATAFGSVLWPVGQIGALFGSLAKMALNRQRELLADAAAVQFTRDPEGLSSALKLIAGRVGQGQLESPAAQSASHLFFAEGSSVLGSLLSSHPPFETRIRRLDPDWDGVLPMLLPAGAAALLDLPDHEAFENVVDAAVEAAAPVTAEGIDRERENAAQLPLANASVRSDVLSEGTPAESAAGDSVSAADREAFLETLAAVRVNRSHQKYNPDITHWPTLIATAAAVVLASTAFTWFTSR